MKELAAFLFFILATVANCEYDLSDPDQFIKYTSDSYRNIFSLLQPEVELNKYFQLLDRKLEYIPCENNTTNLKNYKKKIKFNIKNFNFRTDFVTGYFEFQRKNLKLTFTIIGKHYSRAGSTVLSYPTTYKAKKNRKYDSYKIYKIEDNLTCPAE